MDITTIGLDLAKSIFQVHGVDANGRVMSKAPRRMTSSNRASQFWLSAMRTFWNCFWHAKATQTISRLEAVGG
jgi:hypothetical protein